MPETIPRARLMLAAIEPDVEIVTPEGMQIGDSIPMPAAAGGRWITLGSGTDQDLVLRDQPRGIRRSHCRFIYRGGAYQIQGRLHPEGYRINGEAFQDCTARPLKDGDLLQLGPHVTLRFSQ
jgi:hypothetical protein